MGTLGDALTGLVNMYEDSVHENDKKGYSEVFYNVTQKLLYETLPAEFSEFYHRRKRKNLTLTIEKIEYLDGYFIFGMGTNSVIHFTVKEAPGWLFGIWYSVDKNNRVSLECFGQYEMNIDKFKPSRSSFCAELRLSDDPLNLEGLYLYNLVEMLGFIIYEPALAYCRDAYGWDYNAEYHSRKEAQCTMARDIHKEELRKAFKEYAAQKQLEFFRNLFREGIAHGEVAFDAEELTSPKYSVYFKALPDEETGCFGGLLDFEFYSYDNPVYDNAKEAYKTLIKQLEHEADTLDLYFWDEWDSRFYTIVSPQDFKQVVLHNPDLNPELFQNLKKE